MKLKNTVGVALSLAIGATAAPAFAAEFDGVTLRVGTFGGSWKANIEEIIVPKFEALGGKIEFITGSPNANLAKVIAARGRAPFDVMEILDAQIDDVAELDFLQPLQLDRIPNAASVSDLRKSEMVMGSWDSQEVICYDKDYFAANDIPAPTTYSDLEHEDLAGRVTFPDINSGGGLANFGAISVASGGDEVNVQPGLEQINRLDVTKFWSRGGETLAMFQSDDIFAAVVGGGWCLRIRKSGEPVTSVHPVINDDITGVAKIGWLGVMKSSKNAEAANWFINEYLSKDFQLLFATKTGLMPVNAEAVAELANDALVSEILVLDQDKIAKQLRMDYSKVTIADWTEQWNRSVGQ